VSGRPLHAAVLPAGRPLLDLLRTALAGGPAIMPIDPGLPAPVRDRLLAAMRPHALVQTGGARPLAGGVAAPDDVALVITTSGSTGEPKGVELTASALRHSATATLQRINAAPGDRWLCCLPPSHIAGVQVLIRSVVCGTDPVLVERFTVAAVAGAPAEHIAVVPTMLRRLLDAGTDLARFTSVLVGGAALGHDLLERARAAGAPVVLTYGMTETAGGCVYDGRPLDGVTVDLTTEGRIRISGPVLARGYRLRPDLQAATFAGGRLITSDLGSIADDGRLQVLGRIDDVIVTGGVNVSAAAVGDLLATHPDVAQAAAVAAADEEWGQRVVAIVVPRTPAGPPTLAALRAYVAAQAPASHVPRELVLVEALPMLASGKLDRLAVQGMRR